MALQPRGINQRDDLNISDIYLFSSLSFFVYDVFKSRMCNLTFEFILHCICIHFFFSFSGR